ncbi:MAG: S8 family serine peptidase [Patescibacteria group bacterium]
MLKPVFSHFKNKELGFKYDLDKFYYIKNLSTDEDQLIKDLQKTNNYEYVGRLVEPQTFFTPNDTFYNKQWFLNNTGQSDLINYVPPAISGFDINAPEAWDTTQGSSDIIIAFNELTQPNHPDLVNNMWVNDDAPGDKNSDGCPGVCGIDDDGDGLIDEDRLDNEPGDMGYLNDLVNDDDENGYPDDIHGWNFTTNSGDVYSEYAQHGMGVHGLLAAQGNNSLGVSGVCPQCKVMSIGSEWGAESIIAAPVYAVDNGARILSMSYLTTDDPALHAAVQYAYEAGLLMFGASGNSNISTEALYPTFYSEVLAITAADQFGWKAPWSVFGPKTELMAPGSEILSTTVNDQYAYFGGTSGATPVVAGIAGLVFSANPLLTAHDVKNILRTTAQPYKSWFYAGVGMVDTEAAVQLAQYSNTPRVEINDPLQSTVIANSDTSYNIRGSANGDKFVSYDLVYGRGMFPSDWTYIVQSSNNQVADNVLGIFDVSSVGAGYYTVELRVTSSDGIEYTDKIVLYKQHAFDQSWPIELSAGGLKESLGIFDILDDNNPEFLVADYDSNNIEIYSINGSLVTSTDIDSAVINSPTFVVQGDVTCDGNKDTIVVTKKNWPSIPLIYIYDKSGNKIREFEVPGITILSYNFSNVALGDINGDGCDEIVIKTAESILVVDGNGINLGSKDYSLLQMGSPAIFDINNDGTNEILFSSNEGIDCLTYSNSALSMCPGQWPYYIDGYPGVATIVVDLDSDNVFEIVNFAFSIQILELNGTLINDIQIPRLIPTMGNNETFITGFAIGDINNDQQYEIIFTRDSRFGNVMNGEEQNIYAYTLQGALIDGWPQKSEASGNSKVAIRIDDLDGDGINDILYEQNNRIFAFHGDGSVVNSFPRQMSNFENSQEIDIYLWDDKQGSELFLYSFVRFGDLSRITKNTFSSNDSIGTWQLPFANRQSSMTLPSMYVQPMCSDGTAYNKCNDSAQYCDEGRLISRCDLCNKGCLDGYDCISGQCCQKIEGQYECDIATEQFDLKY